MTNQIKTTENVDSPVCERRVNEQKECVLACVFAKAKTMTKLFDHDIKTMLIIPPNMII